MFGFFGKYTHRVSYTTDGIQYATSTRRQFYLRPGSYESMGTAGLTNQITHLYEYDAGNAGAPPDWEALISGTEITYTGKPKVLQSVASPTNVGSTPINSLAKVNSESRFLGWTGAGALSPVRTINVIFVKPSQIKYYGLGSNNFLGAAVNGVFQLPYLINCRHFCLVSTAVDSTSITGAFPPALEYCHIDAQTVTSIQYSPPSTTKYLVLFVANSFATVTNLNTFIANLSNVEYLLFSNEATGPSSPAAMNIGAGTLDVTHMTNLKAFGCGVTGSLLNNLLYAPGIPLEYLTLTGMASFNVVTLHNLIDIFLASTTQRLLLIRRHLVLISKIFKDTDFKSTLNVFCLLENYVFGTVELTTNRPAITYFEFGLNDISPAGNPLGDSGQGKNATVSSATAGGASLQNGGAGGLGGTNANGANGGNYGGGGGGAARTASGDMKGGAGANGLVKVTYILAGVTTSQQFTTSGSFTTPAGVTELLVECTGAGGSGGTRGTTAGAGGGGGGGAYAFKKLVVTPSTLYNYTVGVGGPAGTASVPTDGVDGGDSYWDAGAACKAQGGRKGLATQTGGVGGAVASSVGDITKNGGNGSTKTTNASPGGGGGGGAGSTGAKNFIPFVNLVGINNPNAIVDISNSQVQFLTLPTNCDTLHLGGNRINLDDATFRAQLAAITDLRVLYLNTDNPSASVSNNPNLSQDSSNATVNNFDLTANTSLQTLDISNNRLQGTLALPLSIINVFLNINALLTDFYGTANFPALTQIRGTGPLTNFNLNYTRVPAYTILTMTEIGNTVVDLSGRTATTQIAVLSFSSCAFLTTVYLPTNSVNMRMQTTGGSGTGSMAFNVSPLLSSISNLDQINYTTLNGTLQRGFSVRDSAMNADLKCGINNFLPTLITCQNNGMSAANVDENLKNLYDAEVAGKYTTTTLAKSINIAGTNAAPTGVYANVATPTTGNEYAWKLANTYLWTVTKN